MIHKQHAQPIKYKCVFDPQPRLQNPYFFQRLCDDFNTKQMIPRALVTFQAWFVATIMVTQHRFNFNTERVSYNLRVLLCSSNVNTLRPRQNDRHFADDTFKRIFLKENVRISIKISLNFVPKSPIDNIPALVQIMARRRPGDKPLSEPMMVSLLTHICVTRPQWVKMMALVTPFRSDQSFNNRTPSATIPYHNRTGRVFDPILLLLWQSHSEYQSEHQHINFMLLDDHVWSCLCSLATVCDLVTYQSREKMAAISQTKFSNAFSWM